MIDNVWTMSYHPTMKSQPWDDQLLDEEEQEIERALENGEMELVPNQEEEVAKLRAAARYTLAKKKSITLRLSELTLRALKNEALKEGLPYQTYIASVLHKHVTKYKSATL